MKAINTLNIEKAQLDERVKSLNELNDGLQSEINKNIKQKEELLDQLRNINEAICILDREFNLPMAGD